MLRDVTVAVTAAVLWFLQLMVV